MITAGLQYAELGWGVFPLAKGSKLPAIPAARDGHGVKDATRDPETIARWAREYPQANIAVACGEISGIVVIDVDPRNGGNASLQKLAAKGRVLPLGPRARTGNGGAHHVFCFDPRIANSKARLGLGIDVKSTGGYIVAAPSWIAPSKSGQGGRYRWEVSPFDTPVPRLPIWVQAMLAPAPRPTRRLERGGSSDIESLANWVARATEGERSNRLHWAACRVGELAAQHRVSSASAGQRLMLAALAAGLAAKEAADTVDSGFKKSGLRYRP
jgi:hypothetical protein